jgi:hypothetical protein
MKRIEKLVVEGAKPNPLIGYIPATFYMYLGWKVYHYRMPPKQLIASKDSMTLRSRSHAGIEKMIRRMKKGLDKI